MSNYIIIHETKFECRPSCNTVEDISKTYESKEKALRIAKSLTEIARDKDKQGVSYKVYIKLGGQDWQSNQKLNLGVC